MVAGEEWGTACNLGCFHQMIKYRLLHLRRLGWVKTRGEGNRPGTRGRPRPARVVGHCALLPVNIHTLHAPPLILLLAKAIVLL